MWTSRGLTLATSGIATPRDSRHRTTMYRLEASKLAQGLASAVRLNAPVLPRAALARTVLRRRRRRRHTHTYHGEAHGLT